MASNNDHQRVRDLLPDKYDKLDSALRKKVEEDPRFENRGFADYLWSSVGTKAVGAVSSTLDFNVFGVFARAWVKARKIRDFAYESVKKPDVPIYLCLGKHEATTTLEPTIDITLDPFGTCRVPLELELAAVFESAELTLRNGSIEEIGAGKCRVTAVLKLGGEKLHTPKESDDLELGRPLVLRRPVQVVPRPTANS